MVDRPWKALERTAARALGGVRYQRERGEVAGDVLDGLLSIECKHRTRIPVLIKAALAQAAKYHPDRPAVAVLREKGGPAIAVLHLEDLERFVAAWRREQADRDLEGLLS